MFRRFRLFSLCVAGAACVALVGLSQMASADESSATKTAPHAYRILMVTQSAGYRHSSVTRHDDKLSVAERTVTDLGISSNLFRVDCTQDAAKEMTPKKLANYDIVFFYTTGDLKIPKENLDYFLNDWLKQRGHGFIGTHSASDTYHNYRPYLEMLGGEFQEHPWGNGSKVWIKVHDKNFPAMKPWGDEFEIADEIYHFKNFEADKVHVLMSMDMAKTSKKKPYHEPIAWCRDWGKGKVFYISLGHDEKVWANPKYQECLLGAIKWELNLEPGDATPNPELSKAEDEKAKAAAEKK
ncbi:MAG TPA: ThuA domain-containing protein [Pirellulales bacterium]|nr:ThuA domain-containing protein [Pirellulales bacterium]